MRNPIPIVYREFYDVPRLFVTEWDGTPYLFDSQFDEAADDYADRYTVYALTDATPQDLAGPWMELPRRGVRLPYRVPVAAVVFDPTKRLSIEADVITTLQVSAVDG